MHKPDDVVKQFSVVRFSSRRAYFQCLLKLPQIWELGVRCMPSNDCITFYRCLLKGEVVVPALGDAYYKAVLGDSPDLPAGPALALQLALPAQTGQPAGAIMDAESSESGEILSAGLHDGNACRYCRAEGCGRHRRDVLPCDGGCLIYEDSLAAHGDQRCKLKCTSHASCFKSRNAGSDVELRTHGARSFSGSLALARSMPGDQAAALEIASADLRRAAGLASDKRSHVVKTENQLDQRVWTHASQSLLVTRHDSGRSLCQRGFDMDLRAHRGIRKRRHFVFQKTAVEPLRATGSHITFSKSHCRATRSH